MASFIRSDLEFILQQILISEAHAAGADLSNLIPNSFLPLGLRTVDGTYNNLVPGQSEYGAADNNFPQLLDPNFLNEGDDAFGPVTNNNYAATNVAGTATVSVADADPRIISNLIVDQTANNPAAVAAATPNPDDPFSTSPDPTSVMSPGLDGIFGTADDKQVFLIPNTAPDLGLTVPFNSWFTLFGQFFDHGLDLVNKGGNGTVFIPLMPDDPLYNPAPGAPNFMALTRATNTSIAPGADGILGTADDVHTQNNQTTPFVDQNQTYTSHPSHQVFLREYILVGGRPVATGNLLDGVNGGLPTWGQVKEQARVMLGIALDDQDLLNLPLLRTDEYGKFIPDANGFAQIATATGFLSGTPGAPVDASLAIRTNHAFLDDIAHTANPSGGKTADADLDIGNAVGPTQYDNELLDQHFITGDGRGNENIGLTTVHTIFHAEHNRLVEHTKQVLVDDAQALVAGGATQAAAVAFLNQWLRVDVATVPTDAQIPTLGWDGERLFQAARFGTEMQYQHLVFEEFARKVQPNIDAFLAPNGYDVTINPAIVAEFAHVVYRFGHSMLTETIDRYDPGFNVVGDANPTEAGNQQIGLIAAFLNPLEFLASGPTPIQAAGAIVRGMTRQVGNEIDEFVTEALRNNLVGLPLDLAVLNLARGRDAGVPSLNAARAEFFAMTGDSLLTPYTSWVDFAAHLRHEESVINFIAAYGTHASITGATLLADKRAAALALVTGIGFAGTEEERLAFLSGPAATTGVDAIDFWVGGLAEQQMPFGGLLGSSFNFVFETQLEKLQNGDRFYYLSRTAGLHFGTELEQNSFANLVMLNLPDVKHLPAQIFLTPFYTLEVDQTQQFTGLGADGRADPEGLVVRDNPATPGADTNYLRFTGGDTVVLGGTAGNDILIAGIADDDTVYGDGGNDRIEGGFGNDTLVGGAGDDIITDIAGDDVIKGEEGNDVISGGSGLNLILAGPGNDFIVTGEDVSTTFGGPGNDFIYGAITNLPPTGNEGDDWIELGTQDGAPGDGFDPRGLDTIRGNDVFVGGGGFDEFIGEGGDDIMFGSDGQEKMDGASGFDWATYIQAKAGVEVDLFHSNFTTSAPTPSSFGLLDLFAFVEGLSGSNFGDILRGDDSTHADLLIAGAQGSILDQTGINLIAGLQAVLGAGVTSFGGGNIILGGGGSDIVEGRSGDDIIEGDKYLNVRISVRQNIDGTGPEIRSVNSMSDLIPDMLSGALNPGQLVIVREILTGAAGIDTAVYSGNRNNYTISVGANGTVVVTDNVGQVNPLGAVISTDGVDTLRGVERIQFADQLVVITPNANANPVGLLTISDATPAVGQTLTASAAGVTDANAPGGVALRPISFTWQFERFPGTGRFEDIVAQVGLGGDIVAADGQTFTVPTTAAGFNLDGLRLRVRAVYQDANGVLENVVSAPTAAVAGVVAPAPLAAIPVESETISAGVHMIRSDLQFILDQIKIAEAHAAGANLLSLLPNERVAFGLRTVDGSFNNLVPGQELFGSADENFPHLLQQNFLNEGDDAFGPVTNNNYALTGPGANVADADPRIISNLIVDQTVNNPAAYEVAYDAGADGVFAYGATAGADGLLGTADDGLGADGVLGGGDDTDDVLKDNTVIVNGFRADGTPFQTFQFGNIAPDLGLTVPFNSWMTIFGQFFDHGLDLVNKGGAGNVFVPLMPDDPLYSTAPGAPNFMVLTRATNTLVQAGADGLFGTADDRHFQNNQTTPFVDQNQTYTSHPSHQVFLREYVLDALGRPVATGKLLEGANGGLATWAEIKAQAAAMLGIVLDDADVLNLPLVATDPYGKFIPNAATGMAQIVTAGGLQSGTLATPVDASLAIRTNHAFLDDIAHTAAPKFIGGVLAPDADAITGNVPTGGTYDNELLDAHFITGDGRGNENIGLTTAHFIFHAEHNRMVGHIKDVILASNDPAFIAQWQLAPGVWNGERLFQAARFGTEMQYQHLVFEEFARKISPQIDLFFAPTQVYDATINPAIVAEFAHTVYRFGHSMLTETIDRFDPSFNADHIGLIQAFLNPLEFVASGPTPAMAAGAIVRGLTRQAGNEIDEFVTEALRNNLVGLPLDLAVLNLARGRDTGVPSLNMARAEFFAMTGDLLLKPYENWTDFAANLRHPESVINFIAAYGTHASIAGATTLEGKRAAALALVTGIGFAGTEAERLAFLNGPAATTGVNAVDFWIGGLAEQQTPFGGMLGSSFNFVFENQMEKLQNADRFYYLERTAGLNFGTELENNSFATLIMANTDATHLSANVFLTPAWTLEVDQSLQFTGLGGDGRADPAGLVIRDNPATIGPDGNYLEYTGGDTVVLGGTAGDDILIAGIADDDTIWGDAGNDRIEGNFGNDLINGGAGDDIITDRGGDDFIKGDEGNDAIHAGPGINIVIGGFGKDFIVSGFDSNEVFGGTGDDFLLGNRANEVAFGNEGNDWIELGAADGAPGDNFDPLGRDAVIGHDVFFGDTTTDIMNAEGGDDVMMGNGGQLDHYLGLSGYDWAVYTHMAGSVFVSVDLISEVEAAAVGVNPSILDKFQSVEGISGSMFADYLIGSNMLSAGFATSGFTGSLMTEAGIDLIAGLRDLLPGGNPFVGEIIFGGGGSDMLKGGWGDEIIDGDRYLNVRLAGVDNDLVPFSYDRMQGELATRVFAGEINPGNIEIVREILTAAGPDFDTAVFTGDLRDFTIVDNGDGSITVTDSRGNLDGTDVLRNIERLQFVDQSVVLGGLNNAPVGLVSISDPTPTENQVLTASIAGVTDGDNVGPGNPAGAITGPVTYVWQIEATSGSFIDIIVDNGVTKEAATGATFTPNNVQVGSALRVRAVYKDANGVLEEVVSAPTAAVANVNSAPTGGLLINDTTPTETQALVAVIAFTDPDNDIPVPGAGAAGGIFVPVYSYQWQQSALGGGGGFADIAGATNATFTPAQAQVNRQLRVIVSYVDGGGTTETVTSAATIVTGDFVAAGVGNFNGTAGEDILNGDGGANVINGLGSNDIINGNGGADTLNGGDGDDTLDGGTGADTVNGDAGNDLINYATGQGPDTVNGGTGTDTLAITGTAGNDTLVLGFNGTVVTTVEGGAVSNVENVTVDLLAGTDRLSYAGNAAGVTINLMTGAASGVSSILNTENSRGGLGADTLIGNDLANDMEGQAGNDTLVGNGGADVLNGEDGDDSFIATLNDGNDNYGGDAGNDTYNMSGTSAAATITSTSATSAETGADTLASIEVYIGSQGNDSITGDGSNETLDGQGGNDTLAGLGGADALIGGTGTDTATYAASAAGVTVNLGANTGAGGDAAGDTFNSIENVTGSNANDNLTGDAAANVLDGGAGNDTLNYTIGGGADTLIGGANTDTANIAGTAGNDTLDVVFTGALIANFEGGTATGVEAVTASLGDGIDTLSYVGTTAAVTVNLGAGAASGFTSVTGIENVVGGSAGDSLTGSALGNVFTGAGGNDTIAGAAGSDTAVFSGNFADYTVSVLNGAGTVTHNLAGPDGIDTLTSIENLQFADQTVFVGNPPPVGTVDINDTTPAEDQLLTATNNFTDASGLVGVVFNYQWQQSAVGGAGPFTNIAGATAATFTSGQAQVGRSLQVVVSYTDNSGNGESITSAATATVTNVNDAPIGTVTINDTTPQENQLLTATNAFSDEDGLPGTFSFQWQVAALTGANPGGVFNNIAGATAATFTPLVGQANRQLRVVVTYTDLQGTAETVTSAATATVTALADIGVTLTGTAGNDTLNGGNGNDTISGLGGADTLNGNGGADTLNGGAGNDVVNGGAGNDLIQYTVGNGNDTINGGTETDTIAVTGLAANETFILAFNGASITQMGIALGGSITAVENFTINLDGGTDRLSFAGSAAAVTIDLTAGTASGGVSSILNVENTRGGNGADTLIGNAGVNDMEGQAGNDILIGMGGNDNALNGNDGDDTFVATLNDGNDVYGGDAGTDTYDLSGTTAGATITSAGSTSAQTGTDTFASIDRYVGSQGNDTMSGDAGNEFFRGEGGNDTINLAAGGNDVIEFGAGFGADTITSFDPSGGAGNQDLLDISDLGITAATFGANVTITDLGANTLVTIAGNTITLVGVNGVEPNAISVTDFILA